MLRIIEASTPELLQAAATLFREYAASLDFSLDYQGFEQELATLPGRYAPPSGCILLATNEATPIGCIAMRELAPEGANRISEMKRLYVKPIGRGTGAGRQLCDELLTKARLAGYAKMKLDTSTDMRAARHLYEGLGFKPCPRYNDDPLPCTLFYELVL